MNFPGHKIMHNIYRNKQNKKKMMSVLLIKNNLKIQVYTQTHSKVKPIPHNLCRYKIIKSIKKRKCTSEIRLSTLLFM